MNQQVVCIGAVLVDELYYCNEPVIAATSNPAVLKRAAGGVMRNIAHHLQLLGIQSKFITVVGEDSDGQWLIENCTQAGIDMSAAVTVDCPTGKYAAILNPDGSLHAAAAANPAEIFLTIELLEQRSTILKEASIILADTNLGTSVLRWLISFCNGHDIPLCIEPVSVSKAKKLAGLDLKGVYLLTPNEDELPSLGHGEADEISAVEDLLARGANHVWLTRGAVGSTMFAKGRKIDMPAVPVTVKDVTGAGDAALAAWVAAFCLYKDEMYCMQVGHTLAAAVIQVDGAIAANITQQQLFENIKSYYPYGT